MRVLYVTTRICWPVTSGAHSRDFYIASHLARHTNLTYIGMASADEGTQVEPVSEAPILPLGNTSVVRVLRSTQYTLMEIVRGLIGPQPLSLLHYTSPLVMQQVERVLSNDSFDIVELEGIFLCSYVARIRKLAPRALLNCDWHNIESEVMSRYADNTPGLPRRLYARRTAHLLRRQEDLLLPACDTHTVCSERERQALLRRNPGLRIEVIPNGVDVESFLSSSEPNSLRRDLIFVGSMKYHPNVDGACFFAREIWPAIRRQRPDLRFVIVGAQPTAEVLKLAEQPGITVTGTVDDVRPFYRSALAAVVPLRVGGGTRLKILEAMAAGVPVISTALGAEGLSVTNGADILLADSPADFVECALMLTPVSELWKKLAEAGRSLARNYDWNAIGDKLLRFYDLHRTVASRQMGS
jgi:glycosyltransferase involved in cell wall biosynthesis